ncbi:MAG: glycosyltransferase family 4 protein [Bacteroidales bacterium]|jgi:glycosyltransferase involved in cell wall biosynthesis|nr:glycosyltransferase family 4 protein [Bacteroidales bacterium]
MFFNQSGRHHWFAENLRKKGYNPTIFCANTMHNVHSQSTVKIPSGKYAVKYANDIPYVFVKTVNYSGNSIQRVKNMLFFYKNLFPAARGYAKDHGKPNVILASSVHPLTMVAGIQIAKEFHIPCICEVRDLWPESIVVYDVLKRNSIITKLLYQGEKWIYKKADSIVMTWEGGKDYIFDKGWDKIVDIKKLKHISNGVVIDSFDNNCKEHKIEDNDLDDYRYKNIVYTGSIRKVNNIGILLDVAKIIKEKGYNNIRFLIYGFGNESAMLKNRCEKEGIKNVLFKGRVEKKYVPSIIKKAYINILHNSSTSLDKYGQSQNKLFEYLAAGKCIVQTYTTKYSILEKYNCGISTPVQNAEEISKVVLEACSDENRCKLLGENGRKAAYDFDFIKLTDKLIDVIESV